MNFINDLKNAQQVENELQQMYIGSGYTVTSTQQLGQFSGYDIAVSSGETFYYSLEVKNDLKSNDTGMVAIEIGKRINNKHEASGLGVTTADYQVYKLRDKFYSISTVDLKKLLRELKNNKALPIVYGGDYGSVKLALIPRSVFKKNTQII